MPSALPDVLTPTVISPRRRRADIPTPQPQASSSSLSTRTPIIVSPPPAQAIVDELDARSPVTAGLPPSLSPLPTGEFVGYTENTPKNIKRKKSRMLRVNRPGFIEIESSLNRTIVWYFRKNIDNVTS